MLVLGTVHTEALPELIYYQLLIVQHSQKFRYPSRLPYDSDFRTWAAQTRTKAWSQINPQCYALAFTSQGSSSQCCPICFVDGGNHTIDCPSFSITPQLPSPQGRQGFLRPRHASHSCHSPLSHHHRNVLSLATAFCTTSRMAIAHTEGTASLRIPAPTAKK